MASGGYSLVGVSRLLISVPFLVAELDSRARELQELQLLSLEHRLNSCSSACGIFLDQGLNSCLLHWQVDSLPLSHQGSHDKHIRIGENWSGVQITHKEPWDYLP